MIPDEMLTLEQAETEFGLKRATLYHYVHDGKLDTYKKAGDRRSYVRHKDLVALTSFKPRKKRTKRRRD